MFELGEKTGSDKFGLELAGKTSVCVNRFRAVHFFPVPNDFAEMELR
jgi:hypothetical protein